MADLIKEIPSMNAALRAQFDSGRTRSLAWRKEQLRQGIRMITENKEKFFAGLRKDHRQIELVAESETQGPIDEAQILLDNLDQWAKPAARSVPLIQKPGHGYVVKEPLGCVLIIAPWNYPYSLLLKPLFGALAAGNCVVIKPSEVSPNCSAVIAELVPQYLDNDCVKVVEGAVPETTALLKERWDYIFYTGNGFVGRIVMRAAAEHLTPVTLELGGKSPVIIDESVNMDVAVRRIVWAKFTNAGQTCVAPDYVLVVRSKYAQLLEHLQKTISSFYGENPQKSADYSRIINQRHCKRVAEMMEGGRVLVGGQVDVSDQYVAPTVLVDVDVSSSLMQDEIFGPLLPIVPVDDVTAAIQFVNARPKPLALYIYSENRANIDRVLNTTSSGGASVNESLMHVICPDLPFGGVGPSGMGAYNGRNTFDTFTHEKGVLHRPTWGDAWIRYPPYTETKLKWIKRLNGFKLSKSKLIVTAAVVGGAVLAYQYGLSANL